MNLEENQVMRAPSYVKAILKQAQLDASKPAMINQGAAVSYGQLAVMILSAVSRFKREGLTAGSVVGVCVSNPVWNFALTCALHRMGVASVSLVAREADLPLGLSALLHQGERPPGYVGSTLEIRQDWFTHPTSYRGEDEFVFPPYSLCRIALSSGTTGVPKPIAMSEEILWDRLTTYAFRGRFAQAERILCGPYHRSHFAFTITCSALCFGKTVVFGGDSAADSASAINLYGVDLAIISTHQLSDIIQLQSKRASDFQGLREIQAGGSPISDALYNNFKKTMSCRLLNTYASTEAGTVAFASVDRMGGQHAQGGVGFITPWASVDICDDEGHILPRGEEGNLRIKAIGMAQPYTPGMTTLQPISEFWPGDLGRVAQGGLLVVLGRSNDTINVGGAKVSLQRLDEAARAAAGVRDAAALAFNKGPGLPEVWIAIVSDGAVDERDVSDRCSSITRAVRPKLIKFVDRIPRNSSGKIMRDELLAMLTSSEPKH